MSYPAKEIVDSYPLLPALFGGTVDSNGNMMIDTYGHKALNGTAMVDNDTTFVLGSCSKSMTAAMIIKICYMKGIRNAMRTITIGSVIPTVRDVYKNITLRQLLCMTSGIIDDWFVFNVDFWRDFVNNTDDMKTQRSLLTKTVCGGALDPGFEPGTAYYYSNIGYVIAAHVVETKFNTTYEDLMKRCLFREMGFTAELPTPLIKSAAGESIGHAVSGPQSAFYMSFWYNQMLKVIDPSVQDPPSVSYKDMTAYVIDEPIQYPPPIMGPAGSIRINMPNWLHYLHTIMMRDPNFLPEKLWQTFLNSGSKATTRQWAAPGSCSTHCVAPPPGHPGEITIIPAKYSFGWTYNPKLEEVLLYSGYILTFTTDLIIHQGKQVVAAATNCGRAQYYPPTNILVQLEKALCPPEAKVIKILLNIEEEGDKKDPGPDAWPHYNGSSVETTIKEGFSRRIGTHHIYLDTPADVLPLLLVLLLSIFFVYHN